MTGFGNELLNCYCVSSHSLSWWGKGGPIRWLYSAAGQEVWALSTNVLEVIFSAEFHPLALIV